jgi:hypothetical protein
MTRIPMVLIAALALTPFAFAQKAEAPKPVELSFEDQFEQKRNLSDLRGKVVIVVYGDRNGIESSRELGEKLHVLFHPTAKGLTPEKAKLAPVIALAGVADGKASPDVVVVPVACAGAVPGPIKALIRRGLKKDAADTPVWIDFGTVMADKFVLKEGQANVAVFDAGGYLRMKVNGTPDKAIYEKLLQTTQNLRAEAAGLR